MAIGRGLCAGLRRRQRDARAPASAADRRGLDRRRRGRRPRRDAHARCVARRSVPGAISHAARRRHCAESRCRSSRSTSLPTRLICLSPDGGADRRRRRGRARTQRLPRRSSGRRADRSQRRRRAVRRRPAPAAGVRRALEATTLSLVDVDRPASPLWQQSLDVSYASMAIDRAATRWRRARARDRTGPSLPSAAASSGGRLETQQWIIASAERTTISPLAVNGSRVLVEETRYDGVGDSRWFGNWYFAVQVAPADADDVRHRRRLDALDAVRIDPVSCLASPSRYIDERPRLRGERWHAHTRGPHERRRRDADSARAVPYLHDDRPRVSRWMTGWSRAPFALDLEGDRADHRRPRESSWQPCDCDWRRE